MLVTDEGAEATVQLRGIGAMCFGVTMAIATMLRAGNGEDGAVGESLKR